jgi:glycosyltransferase involved in cell wall biosynthesis
MIVGRTVVFDVRCLQDAQYRDRGVGRLGANLVRSARNRCIRVIGIADPTLPELEQRFRCHFDEIRHDSFLTDNDDQVSFVQLSPMTHDPLFIARLLDCERVFTASVVHDFIPLAMPDQYLPKAAQKIDYDCKLRWLSRYDHFFANSDWTKREIARVLGIREERISVSFPAIDPVFTAGRATSQSASPVHILAVGGRDRRKNVDCAIGAHANSWVGRTRSVPLLVSGGYPSWWEEQLRGLYRDEKGLQSLLMFMGNVSDKEFVQSFRNAACVVVPSRAEGFSIPVAEAMAVGVPVFASSIPAHWELLENPDVMFDSEDHLRLACLMDRVILEEGFRDWVAKDQSTRWQRFQADTIARLFWTNLDKHAADRMAAPAIVGRRPRIAVLAPLPPDRSGVADYTAASLGELAKFADVYAFTPTRSPKSPEGAVAVAPLSALPFLQPEFDRVISVMGNSHFHTDIYRLLMRYGGACIEHDNRLLGFYNFCVGKERAREVAERELGRPLMAGELDRWLSDESTLEATFLGELAQRSRPFLVHSRGTARIVRERFGIESSYLPFSVYRAWQDDQLTIRARLEARRRLRMSPTEVTIITLGSVGEAKAPYDCIWALEMLRGWGIPAKLHFVGEMATDPAPLLTFCRELQLTKHVEFVSKYLSEGDYRDYLLAADVAVQLRTHLLGGLSGAMLDCIAVGIPTVANQDLAESMEAPSYVFRIADRPSPVLLAEALAAAIESSEAIRRQQDDERRAYCDVHSFRGYAERLCAALSLEIRPAGSSLGRKLEHAN